jgi:hypothetical protein
MHTVFAPTIFSTPVVSCPKCNWQGKGEDIKQEELFLTDAIEIFCPSCDEYFGFVSTNEPDEQLTPDF